MHPEIERIWDMFPVRNIERNRRYFDGLPTDAEGMITLKQVYPTLPSEHDIAVRKSDVVAMMDRAIERQRNKEID